MHRPSWPGLQRHKTRHGKTVWYVRLDRGPRRRLMATPGTQEWRAEYEAAYTRLLKGETREEAPDKKPSKDTLNWLWAQYCRSPEWTQLSLATRRQRENIMKHVLVGAGTIPIAKITRKLIQEGRDKRKETPSQANNFLKTLRQLFGWAVSCEHMPANPVDGVKMLKENRGDGFPMWTEEEIARFEARWPLGTRERLAFAVLLYTGLRRGDAATLGRQHFKAGSIVFTPAKTKNSSGVTVTIPVHPELGEAIKACMPKGLFVIETAAGKVRVKEGFGNWFHEISVAAGVNKNCHGLRKSAATRVAEAGATEAQLMALFGWTDPAMARHYTKLANAKKLAAEAAAKVGATGSVVDLFGIGS